MFNLVAGVVAKLRMDVTGARCYVGVYLFGSYTQPKSPSQRYNLLNHIILPGMYILVAGTEYRCEFGPHRKPSHTTPFMEFLANICPFSFLAMPLTFVYGRHNKYH